MKFVHTADVHLNPDHPERMKALRKVCEKAKALNANLLVIAGDLFDSDSAAKQLRPQMRSLFGEFALPVLIVAGNHDREAYGEGTTYGDLVTAISREKTGTVVYEGITFAGLPFHPGWRASELLEMFTLGSSGTNVLVAHASFFAKDPLWQTFR